MSLLKRNVMTLYSGKQCFNSHQVRIVLAEKGVSVDVITMEDPAENEDLLQINPYGSLPTLVDRGDLALYDPQVIMEYLEERFPHPPLMPVYPIQRAKKRLMMHRIRQDWYSLLENIANNQGDVKTYKKELLENLVMLSPVFAEMPYFLSEEFSLVDCCLAPLLWRLPYYGIKIPARIKSVHAYMERVFSRDSFQVSLTDAERELYGEPE